MKKHIPYPKIRQFTEIIQQITRQATFVGLDENGEAIYNPLLPKPSLLFRGTCKGHGTNFGCCYNNISGIWYQSRENEITVQKDNASSAFFAESRKDIFNKFFQDISREHDIDLNNNTISIYGEMAGKGIQKNVGIAELEKALYIFGVKISPFDETQSAYWVDCTKYSSPENRIFNVHDFKTYEVEVDFNNPKLAQNRIIEMTQEVEAECPIAKHFGVSGVGEGIVFSVTHKDSQYIFKSKGLLHAGKSKVKVLRQVDDEKLRKVIEIADKVTQTWRLEQMLTKACDLLNGGTIERKKLGDYLRLVVNDILEEESHVIAEAGLEPKEINAEISKIAKNYFFEQEQIQVGL